MVAAEPFQVGVAVGLALLWLVWTARVWWRHRPVQSVASSLPPVLVAYASQTGTARAHALRQQQLMGGAQQAAVLSLAELAPKQLAEVQQAVFVVSTYGDGEPPDNGRRFYRELQALNQASNTEQEALATLNYTVVALGDSSYPKFCKFGDDLHEQLARIGAKPSSPVQKLDQHHRSVAIENPLHKFRLTARERLNTTSDAGLFHLRLQPTDSRPTWQAGDVVAIAPHNDPLATPRRYSVASVCVDHLLGKQELSLVVRQHIDEQGRSGVCSGWLTHTAALNDEINLQVIANPSCHIPDHQPPLLLIGAGSGLAGLRGHLAERAQQSTAGAAWLIYGERSADPSQLLFKELEHWQQADVVTRFNYACSRVGSPAEQVQTAYVQNIVEQHAIEINQFVGKAGHIYVCGRYEGMGTAVDAALREALGALGYQKLVDEGRYHRDLY